MRILIVEDEERIATNLQKMLQKQAFAVDLAATVAIAKQKINTDSYDLAIIDWMLPDGTGIDVITAIRTLATSTLILMVTARSQVEDKVEGLENGADDYLTKPFAMTELIARVKALLRRLPHAPQAPILKIADLEINTNTHSVIRAGKTITLSPREYGLLEYLAKHVGVAQERLDLLTHVWDENADPFSNTVDVHIRYLRHKLDDPFRVKLIKTVKGKGYMICPD